MLLSTRVVRGLVLSLAACVAAIACGGDDGGSASNAGTGGTAAAGGGAGDAAPPQDAQFDSPVQTGGSGGGGQSDASTGGTGGSAAGGAAGSGGTSGAAGAAGSGGTSGASGGTGGTSGSGGSGTGGSPGTFGYDPGMQKRCAKTNDGANYFEVTNDCYNDDHWLLGNQAEVTGGVSCGPGPNGSSYPITLGVVGNPVLVFNANQVATGWEYELKVDHVNNALACNNPAAFHWYAITDDWMHGTVMPNMDSMHSQHTVWYSHYVPSGASRAMVASYFEYRGVGETESRTHMIEVNLASENWGDSCSTPSQCADPAQVISFSANHAGTSSYLTLDGSAFGLSVTSGGPAVDLAVDWHDLLAWAISHGYFPPIDYGYPRNVSNVYVGIETVGHAIAHLKTSNFRLMQ